MGNIMKSLRDIMRNDEGVNGDAQRIEQIVWMLFLKVYDSQERLWEFEDSNYKSIIPEKFRWRNWAKDNKDGKAMTGEELENFINNELFPALKDLKVTETTPIKQAIVKSVFRDLNNYMKKGTLLRQVTNVIDGIEFTNSAEKHEFGEIYETMLSELQSAGSSGEFYTPRPVTNFMTEMLAPQLGEKIADFACGTGGFLTSALTYLDK